jgi:hypothetical protein
VITLAQALLPLYRGYLRRLDEMAARIGEETVLREPTARDEGQVLVRHASGFVLRFDVADSKSGETFEVHGAHPDDPAERELQLGALPFRVKPGNWEELQVRCSFRGPPPADDAAALAELLHGWAVLAAQGGFGSLRERASVARWSGRLHSASVRIEGPEVVAVLDLGTCPPEALDSLADALAGFGSERAPLSRVTVGGRGDR